MIFGALPTPRDTLPGVPNFFFSSKTNDELRNWWALESFTIYYRNYRSIFADTPNPYWLWVDFAAYRSTLYDFNRYLYMTARSGWEGKSQWKDLRPNLDSILGTVRARAGTGTIQDQTLFQRFDTSSVFSVKGEHYYHNTITAATGYVGSTFATGCNFDQWGTETLF